MAETITCKFCFSSRYILKCRELLLIIISINISSIVVIAQYYLPFHEFYRSLNSNVDVVSIDLDTPGYLNQLDVNLFDKGCNIETIFISIIANSFKSIKARGHINNELKNEKYNIDPTKNNTVCSVENELITALSVVISIDKTYSDLTALSINDSTESRTCQRNDINYLFSQPPLFSNNTTLLSSNS